MPARLPGRAPRTATGARLVEVPERDPVAERGAALAEAFAGYEALADDAWRDYLAEARAAYARWRERLDGATAEYGSAVERIRAQP